MWFWLISLPSVVVSPTSVDFGSQAVGATSAAVPVTLTNNSRNPVTIASIVSSSGEFGETTTCTAAPSTLAAGATCTISVTFTLAVGGQRTGTITVTHNSSGS